MLRVQITGYTHGGSRGSRSFSRVFCLRITELSLPFSIERETVYLTFGPTMEGQVSIFFGSIGTKFDEVVTWVEFSREITKKVTAEGFDRLMNGSLNKDNRIGLGIENPLTKMVQGLVESGMTGGETGHKHIEIGRIGFTVLLHLVMDFHLMRLLCCYLASKLSWQNSGKQKPSTFSFHTL